MSTPLQALERMLLSQERREQSRVQETLGMMQLAQSAAFQKQQLEMSKRKQDIELFGSKLDLIKKSNQIMKTRSAENFLQQSGLSALYSEFKDDESDALKNAVERLTGKDGWFGAKEGIDKQIAQDLVSATWASYEQENPDAIVSIASKLHYIDESETFKNSYDKKLFKSFEFLGVLSPENRDFSLNQFKTMRKSLDNEVKLTQEIIEFARGDYKINEEFDLISEDLKDVKIKPPVIPPKTNYETILPPDKIIQTFESKSESLESEKNEIIKSIKQLEDLERDASFYRKINMEIPEQDLLALQNIDAVYSEYERRLKEVEFKLKELAGITRQAKRQKEIRKIEEMPDVGIAP